MHETGHRDLDLPPEFVRLNEADPAWLRGLPGLLDRLARRWSLTVEGHFPDIAYNYVAPATRRGPDARARPCVLKLSRRIDEAANEIAALRLWDGRGAARLIEADAGIGALLIERVEPGTMLVELAESDDDAATLVAAGLLRRLWEPVVEPADLRGLRPLASWCAAYDRNREALSRGADGFPSALFQRADALRRDLLASTTRPTAIHGDMHHYNVLRDRPAGWRAIDPKGLAGDRCFDVCQFFRNPRDRPPTRVRSRRLDIFCAELGLDRQRTKDWCLVHAVLDACWEFEGPAVRERGGGFSHETNDTRITRPTAPGQSRLEGGEPWRGAVARAEATLSF
jgi:streptomycin 6-kinase